MAESQNAAMRRAEEALRERDGRLGALIARQRPLVLRPQVGYFAALCRSIVGQQVSVAAAATIFGRLEAATGLRSAAVAALSEEQAKAIGLSRQKLSYVRDLARHFVADAEVYQHLERSSDDKVIRELTLVKGIGVWTAQMFLIFTLRRLDVFAPDDVGLQRAMVRLYGLGEASSRQQLVDIAAAWSPYRSVACLHLWASLNNEPSPERPD